MRLDESTGTRVRFDYVRVILGRLDCASLEDLVEVPDGLTVPWRSQGWLDYASLEDLGDGAHGIRLDMP